MDKIALLQEKLLRLGDFFVHIEQVNDTTILVTLSTEQQVIVLEVKGFLVALRNREDVVWP